MWLLVNAAVYFFSLKPDEGILAFLLKLNLDRRQRRAIALKAPD